MAKKEMLINVSEGEECRIAIVEDGRLEELYMERTSSTSHVNNIYKGRVTNVEPSIQAAFVDFGLGRNGFLHISDLLPSYFGRKGDDVQEFIGKKMARRDRPPIQRCLRRGDDIVVQVIKEGIGTKGPTLSTYLSVSGRMLVMMPGVSGRGVSRKIEDEDERRRLKQILDGLTPPDDCGFIIRTESVGKTKLEVERDLKYLARLWEQIKKKIASGPGPMELYTEGDLVSRTVRDLFTSDVEKIVVDNKDVARRVKDVIKITNPRTRNRVELYEDPVPLFHRYGIEKDIEMMYSRHVPLPSGGSLVIDSTEAIVAIDVNSGKNRDHSDAEMTAFKTDMEAADEIPRQLRLRDLGGVIICDFIDLRFERNRRDLERRLNDEFKKDRARTKVLRMSQFGIIEMTRQRMRPSLKRSIYFDCPHCKGAGLVKTPESMSLDVMRRLAIATNDARVVRVELSVCTDVAFYLQNRKRQQLADIETHSKKQVVIRSDATLGLDEMRLDLFDSRDGLVVIEELGISASPPHITQLGAKSRAPAAPPARGRGARPDARRPAAPPPRRLPAPAQREPEPADDRYDLESAEADFEDRERRMDEDVEETDDRTQAPRGASRDSDRSGEIEEISDESDEPVLSGVEGSDAFDREVAPAAPFGGVPSRPAAAGGENGPASGDEQGGRRRRRRRGRRGRGRGGRDVQPGVSAAEEVDSAVYHEEEALVFEPPADGAAVDEPAPESDEAPETIEVAGEALIDSYVEESSSHQVATEEEDPSEPNGNKRSVAPTDESGQGDGPFDKAQDGPRRRRRRGGRGRGRKAATEQNGKPFDEAHEGPSNQAQDGPSRQAQDRPLRQAQNRPFEQAQGRPPAPKPALAKAPVRRLPPPPVQPQPLPEPVRRTGSTDRHLINDDPIIPEPIHRPRSYRDLDQIPDDLD